MSRLTCFGICTVVISMLMGCAMCCGPHDDDFNVYGGKFHRVNPAQGRVGSLLSDPAYQGGGPSSGSNLSDLKPVQSLDPPTEGRSEEEIREEMQRLREELQLDGPQQNELPRPTPQPDVDDRETARGWQNRLRSRNRQWR